MHRARPRRWPVRGTGPACPPTRGVEESRAPGTTRTSGAEEKVGPRCAYVSGSAHARSPWRGGARADSRSWERAVGPPGTGLALPPAAGDAGLDGPHSLELHRRRPARAGLRARLRTSLGLGKALRGGGGLPRDQAPPGAVRLAAVPDGRHLGNGGGLRPLHRRAPGPVRRAGRPLPGADQRRVPDRDLRGDGLKQGPAAGRDGPPGLAPLSLVPDRRPGTRSPAPPPPQGQRLRRGARRPSARTRAPDAWARARPASRTGRREW